MASPGRSLAWLGFALLLLGCRERAPEARPRAVASIASASGPAGVAARGAELVRAFECSRCHEGSGAPPPTLEKGCTACHQAIVAGTFAATPEALAHWQTRIDHFIDVPSLAGSQKKLQRSWLERFLLEPHDLRPALAESMPRLRLTPEQARDIATYLAPSDAERPSRPEDSLERGRALLEAKGCGTCHRMSGAPALPPGTIPVPVALARLTKAIRLAPDLRFARERLLPAYLTAWLEKPSAVAPDALMPDIPLSRDEVRDIAAYVLFAPLDAPKLAPAFARLPVLTRKVAWSEVKARVFRNTCWHCHSDPDYAIGDGGPGNTGGFGFPGRYINLAEHEGLLAGYLDERDKRRSLFVPEPPSGDGHLVRSLLARHAEEAGHPDPSVRGMPLGLPALPAEEIQLVESWIAQGRAM